MKKFIMGVMLAFALVGCGDDHELVKKRCAIIAKMMYQERSVRSEPNETWASIVREREICIIKTYDVQIFDPIDITK